MNEFSDAKQIMLLGIALAVGLLIGIERGWTSREAKEGDRIAGLRTYGLISLLGACAGLLAQYIDVLVFGFIFIAFSIIVAVSYVIHRRNSSDSSITSLVTMLLTFLLGSLVILGHVTLASSTAVVVVLLLRFKQTLHLWLRKLGRKELHAALQLLLISVVLLPALPDKGYGPWQSFNPYEAWWMVVLISSISFVGYFTMKISGLEKGIILTALTAGLVSSTALTLHFSRLFNKQPLMKNMLSAGILLACGTMFPRILLVASIINPALFELLALPIVTMTLFTFACALINWRPNSAKQVGEISDIINPLAFKSALVFGALLVLIMLLGKAAIHYYGETGLYMLAFLSGIADVDPINLTLSKMSQIDLPLNVAVLGILIAASTNSLVKAGLAVLIGGRELLLRVCLPLLISAFMGLMVFWLLS